MMQTGTVSGQLAAIGRRIDALDAPSIALGELVDGLGQAGIGMTILILTLPALIPVPGPFGMVFGSLIAFVSVQLMFGARRLWLPEVVRRRLLPVSSVRAMVDRGAPLFALGRALAEAAPAVASDGDRGTDGARWRRSY